MKYYASLQILKHWSSVGMLKVAKILFSIKYLVKKKLIEIPNR